MSTKIGELSVLYLSCHSMQPKECEQYCFDKCGRVIVGAIELNDLYWWPCRQKECPYLAEETEMGTFDAGWGDERIVVRKLREWPK